MSRFVIIHHHIFKNAGSTLDFVLHKNFGGNFSTYDLSNADGNITQERFLRFVDENKKIEAISSHHFHTKQFEYDRYVFFDMIFLRHPLDRLRAIFDFYQKSEINDDQLSQFAKDSSLREFIDYLVRFKPHQINNVQVNLLANLGVYVRPPNNNDLNVAKRRLSKVSCLGVLCLFDEALVAMEYFLRPAFGGLDLSYESKNISQRMEGVDIQFRLEIFKEECGELLYEQLLLMNKLDLKLYEKAKKEVNRRIKLIPDFQERMTEFNDRSVRLKK